MNSEEVKSKNPERFRIRDFLVGEAGLEPARPQWTLEPESSESTNSTTRPYRVELSLNAWI